MLKYTDIKQGTFFKLNGNIYETIDSTFSKKSRQKGSNQVKVKDVVSGAVTKKTLHAPDKLENASIDKEDYIFMFIKGESISVHEPENRSKVIKVSLPMTKNYDLLPFGTKVTALKEGDDILTLQIPIKADLIVKEAPPATKGNTAQGGNKRVVLETGASINVPLFIKADECVRVNTETREYVERVR